MALCVFGISTCFPTFQPHHQHHNGRPEMALTFEKRFDQWLPVFPTRCCSPRCETNVWICKNGAIFMNRHCTVQYSYSNLTMSFFGFFFASLDAFMHGCKSGRSESELSWGSWPSLFAGHDDPCNGMTTGRPTHLVWLWRDSYQVKLSSPVSLLCKVTVKSRLCNASITRIPHHHHFLQSRSAKPA